MFYRQDGGGAQPTTPTPEQLQQMFQSLPPEIQKEITALPKEKQAQMIVMAFQKMQEIMAEQQQGQAAPQQGAPEAAMPQPPQQPQPAMRYGGMNQRMNRYQEGGVPQQPQGNPSNQHMQELMQGVDAAGGASQGPQAPAQGQPQGQPQQSAGAPQLTPEQQQQIQQMFAQLPPDVQAQIKQMPPEQQPQAIVQAFQQMQEQGNQEQGAPQPQGMMEEPVDPNSVHKMKDGGMIYGGYRFKSYNTLHNTPKGDTHSKMALMRKGGNVTLIKYGQRMQTGGYIYGEPITGPKTYQRTTKVMADTTGLGKPMNENKTTIKNVSKNSMKMKSTTPSELKKRKYNLNQDFRSGGYLPKANFGQFVGDMGKTWVNSQLAGFGSSEPIFDKSDFKTKAGRDINNTAFNISKGTRQLATNLAPMFTGANSSGLDLSSTMAMMSCGGSIHKMKHKRKYQDGGSTQDDDSQYDELYDALEDNKKEMLEQQIEGYLQENNVPLQQVAQQYAQYNTNNTGVACKQSYPMMNPSVPIFPNFPNNK